MRYLLCFLLIPTLAWADIDTLKDTSEVYDCRIYSWENCVGELGDEDCRRYNSGGLVYISVGNLGASQETRALFMLPGWNDILPDSSEFQVYCYLEESTTDYTVVMYPVTTQWYEGEEAAYGMGDYPNPDSGATWYHAYLDVGDADSVSWNLSGGDFASGVACSTTITGTGSYFSFKNFNRILNYWDTSGTNYGFLLINYSAFFNSGKLFRSSEYTTDPYQPLAILFYPDAEDGIPNVRHGPEGSGQRHGPDGSSVRHGP